MNEERNYHEYCTCGAQHGTIDGSYTCNKDCLSTYLKAHPEDEKDYSVNEIEEEN